MNGDESLARCEVYMCLVMAENEFREEHCPSFPMADCSCDDIIDICVGMWDCDDIEYYTLEILNYYDTNGDGSINPEDDIE